MNWPDLIEKYKTTTKVYDAFLDNFTDEQRKETWPYIITRSLLFWAAHRNSPQREDIAKVLNAASFPREWK